ncbi:natural killer cells antigen CD94-like [Fundulus diaphanus]
MTIYSEVKPKKTAPTEPSGAAEEAATLSDSRLLLVWLGILCVLLVVSVAIIIYISMTMIKQQAEISDLSTKNQQLTVERKMMENQTEELSRERDELNRTFQAIMTFDTFPVKDFCPDKKCQPCQKGWKVFQEKCYLFYDERAPWKTWRESREYCQGKAADLVVIDDLQEQIFVSNHTKYYHDEYHGYWLGLRETGNNWMWVDGRDDTLGFWMKDGFGSSGPVVLLIPGRNPTQNWDKAQQGFKNKFICERQVLLKS